MNDAALERHRYRFGPAVDTELLEDALEVNLDRLVGTADRLGNVVVAVAPGDIFEYLALPRREIHPRRVFGQPAGDGGWDNALAAVHDAHRISDIGWQHVLQ